MSRPRSTRCAALRDVFEFLDLPLLEQRPGDLEPIGEDY
jgi:hypothetical protein